MGLQCVIVLCFLTILHVLGDYTCMTPLGVPGYVVHIDECGPLHNLDRNDQKTDEEFLYLQQSVYNVTSDFKFNVCCPSKNKWSNTIEFHPIMYPEPNTTRISRKKYDIDSDDDDDEHDNFRPECKRTVAPPDPHKFCCGISQIILYESKNGLVYDSGFPWVVLLEYSNGMQLCGGSLISMKFVLTAAHCFTSSNGAPELVHLGDFDRTRAKTTDDTMTIPVESYFLHPQYDQEKHIHDIALIKLASFARYSADINPICLPTFDVVVSGAPYPEHFGVAGWGSTETGDFSANKLFTAVPYANHSECQKYHTHKIQPEQICAGGGTGDSCGGDSGGPMEMLEPDIRKYSLAGVVSYGSRHCAQLGNPSVYTNVYRYKDWIYNLTKV